MSNQSNHHTNKNTIIFTIIAVMLLIGIGIGIYGATKVDPSLTNEEDSYIDEEDDFALPANANSIDCVEIFYNDSDDYIYIDSSDLILHSTSNTSDTDSVDSEALVSTTNVMEYIFDNVVSKLGASLPSGDESWSITVYSMEGTSYASGEGEKPEWVNQLINKVEETIATGTTVEEPDKIIYDEE